MSPRTPLQNEEIQEKRRTRILEAAFELFGSKGYRATSIAEIANYAGISKGLIYHYYSSKEELLKGIFKLNKEQAEKDLHLELATVSMENVKPKETIRSIVDVCVSHLHKRSHFIKLSFAMALQPEVLHDLKQQIDEDREKWMQLLTNVFEQMNFDDPVSEAYHLIALMDGIAFGYIVFDNYPLEDIRKLVLKKYNL